jgi:hypothetical protein
VSFFSTHNDCLSCARERARREGQNEARAEFNYAMQRLQNRGNALKTVTAIRALTKALNWVLRTVK